MNKALKNACPVCGSEPDVNTAKDTYRCRKPTCVLSLREYTREQWQNPAGGDKGLTISVEVKTHTKNLTEYCGGVVRGYPSTATLKDVISVAFDHTDAFDQIVGACNSINILVENTSWIMRGNKGEHKQ
jgi:hypothetical protein